MCSVQRVVLIGLLSLVSGCHKDAPLPDKFEGQLTLVLREQRTLANGQVSELHLFEPKVVEALRARGLTVATSDGGTPTGITVVGKVQLADEVNKDSSLGGPVAFFFVNGAYDLKLTDASTGQALGTVNGPLDVRDMKERALPATHQSYEGTVAAIVDDASPQIADRIIRKLWEAKRVKAK